MKKMISITIEMQNAEGAVESILGERTMIAVKNYGVRTSCTGHLTQQEYKVGPTSENTETHNIYI